MQTAIIVGIVIALPVIIYQVWAFLSPALHQHEKRIGVPVILGAVFLFVCGAAMAWYLVLPMTLRVLFHFDDKAFDQMITANEYFGFVTSLVLAMGAVFELPIACSCSRRSGSSRTFPRQIPPARSRWLVRRRGVHHAGRIFVTYIDRADGPTLPPVRGEHRAVVPRVSRQERKAFLGSRGGSGVRLHGWVRRGCADGCPQAQPWPLTGRPDACRGTTGRQTRRRGYAPTPALPSAR